MTPTNPFEFCQAEFGIAREEMDAKDSPITDVESIDVFRLRSLKKLYRQYHDTYANPNRLARRARDMAMNDIIGIYIPNVMRDFPALLRRLDMQESFILSQHREILELREQRNKAYRECKWKINDYQDTAPIDTQAILTELFGKNVDLSQVVDPLLGEKKASNKRA